MEAVAEANDGIIPDELNDRFDELTGTFDEKVERCSAALIVFDDQWAIADAKVLSADAEVKRRRAIRNSIEAASKRLKQYLGRQLDRVGKDKIETPEIRFRVQNAKQSISWPDPKAVPDQFKDATITMRADIASDLLRILEDEAENLNDNAMNIMASMVFLTSVNRKRVEAALGTPEWIEGIPGVNVEQNRATVLY